MTCVLLKFWNYRLHPTKENLCQLSNFTRQSNQGRGSEEQAIVCKAMTKEKSFDSIDVQTRGPVITSLNQICSLSQILMF